MRGAWTLLLAGLAACAPVADGGPVDAGRDAGGPAVDAARDAVPPPDAAPDGARDGAVDGGVDAAPDAREDAAPADAGPPDARPEDAAPGWSAHLGLGPVALGDEITVDVPPEATSALVQARGRRGGLYAIVDVTGPDGPRTGPAPGDGPWRTSANPEVAVALWPGADDAPLAPGRYQLRVISAGPEADPVEVEVWLKAGARRLAVDVFFPPAGGRTADDPALARMALALEGALEALVGVPVEATLRALDPAAPAALALDTRRGDLAALDALADATPPDAPGGIAVYVMVDVTDGGVSQSGFSGGLPAPFGLPGTAASVIAIRSPLLDDFPQAVADLAVHELGHGLGLYHTTEPYGDRHDPIADTAECPLACDRDGDGVLFASECGGQGRGMPPCQGAADNLMFWTLGGRRDATPGQRRVVQGHPAIAP